MGKVNAPFAKDKRDENAGARKRQQIPRGKALGMTQKQGQFWEEAMPRDFILR